MCSKTGELLTDVLTLMIGVIFSPFDSWDLLFIEGYSRCTHSFGGADCHQLQKAWLFCAVITFSLELF